MLYACLSWRLLTILPRLLQRSKKCRGHYSSIHHASSQWVMRSDTCQLHQWRIQKFKNLGAQSRRSIIFRSGDCLDPPLHIPYDFVMRVENKIHIVIIAFDCNKVHA